MVKKPLPSEENQFAPGTKQERREKRRTKEKTKILHHGKGIAKIYRDAVLKRTSHKR